jgi:hypothetical protein
VGLVKFFGSDRLNERKIRKLCANSRSHGLSWPTIGFENKEVEAGPVISKLSPYLQPGMVEVGVVCTCVTKTGKFCDSLALVLRTMMRIPRKESRIVDQWMSDLA